MKAANDEENGNGKVARRDEVPCPFYDMGTADFHEFRKDFLEQLRTLNETMAKQCELLTKTVDAALTKTTGVPIRTHIIVVASVIVGIIGAETVHKLLEHFTS